MSLERLLAVCLVLFAGVITWWLLVPMPPEVVNVQSSDGVVTLSGVAPVRPDEPWSVAVAGLPLGAPLIGEAYDVRLPAKGAGDAQLFVRLPGAEQLYVFDDVRHIWWPAPSSAKTEGGVRASLNTSSLVAAGLVSPVVSPSFISDLDTFLARYPDNTRTYTFQVAVAEGNGPFIGLPSATLRGSCGGQLQNAKESTYGSADRVIEGRAYRLMIEWGIGDEPCGENAPLTPLTSVIQ